MEFHQFGADDQPLVVYFHGVPGAPAECALFDAYGKEYGLTFMVYDRFSVDPALRGAAYFGALAKAIVAQCAGRKVDVIGFSIGAFIALQTCRQMANQVRSLHLVSAAAPLEAGDFLSGMAGKQVFRLAKASPVWFMAFSRAQSWLTRLFPRLMFRQMFASAGGGDKPLTMDWEFQSVMMGILRGCFDGGGRGYARDLFEYVQPWQWTLSEMEFDTHIWHGSEDNWAPQEMADYLHAAIPGCVSLKKFAGLSHYSCLYRAAPEICRCLAGK